jgi:uncharacterized membrane protein
MVVRRARLTAALLIASLSLLAFVPAVSADDGLEVTTPYPAVAVAPGSDVSLDLTVSSIRTADVSLELGGVPDGWTANLLGGGYVVDGVSVTEAEPAEVRLDIAVPGDAAGGETRLRVTATGGGATDVLIVTVRVDAAAAGDLTLETSSPVLTGSSETAFTFSLTFRNDTAQDVTVSVSAQGPAGWDVEATLTGETQAASTVVEAGATQAVSVAVTPAEDAEAGDYPIVVTAQAGDRAATADLGVRITGSYAMTLSTPGDLLSASGSAGSPTTQAFEITNTGTAPLTAVEVTANPPTGWEVTFDPASLATLAPNDTGTITATITPSGEAVAGDYVITFNGGATEEDADASAQIRFTVETSPIWALVGLGIIALILGGLFYIFRTYGRR